MTSPLEKGLILSVGDDPFLYAGARAELRVGNSVTVLVGPNGTGKTRTLRQLQSRLVEHVEPLAKHVRFLAAGRSSPLEKFRANIDHPNHDFSTEGTYIGNASYKKNWHSFEGVTGDYLGFGLITSS